MHCYVVNNNYQQASKVLLTFVPINNWAINDYFTSFIKNAKNYWWKFSFDEAWFTDQNNRPLEIEDDVKLTLIIGIG